MRMSCACCSQHASMRSRHLCPGQSVLAGSLALHRTRTCGYNPLKPSCACTVHYCWRAVTGVPAKPTHHCCAAAASKCRGRGHALQHCCCCCCQTCRHMYCCCCCRHKSHIDEYFSMWGNQPAAGSPAGLAPGTPVAHALHILRPGSQQSLPLC